MVLMMHQAEAEAGRALRPGLQGSEATRTSWTHQTWGAAARVWPARKSWRMRMSRVAAAPAPIMAVVRPPSRYPNSASPRCARSTTTRWTRTRHWSLATLRGQHRQYILHCETENRIVLNQKRLSLLRSPEVVQFLQKQQQLLNQQVLEQRQQQFPGAPV